MEEKIFNECLDGNGEYGTDFIKCILWSGIVESTTEYCKKEDIVGIKGRLQCLSGSELQGIAERVSFLSSGRN